MKKTKTKEEIIRELSYHLRQVDYLDFDIRELKGAQRERGSPIRSLINAKIELKDTINRIKKYCED